MAHLAQAFSLPIANGGGWPHHNAQLHAGVANGWRVEFHYVMWMVGNAIFKNAPQPEKGWVTLSGGARPGHAAERGHAEGHRGTSRAEAANRRGDWQDGFSSCQSLLYSGPENGPTGASRSASAQVGREEDSMRLNRSRDEIERDLLEQARETWGDQRVDALRHQIHEAAGWISLVGKLRPGDFR